MGLDTNAMKNGLRFENEKQADRTVYKRSDYYPNENKEIVLASNDTIKIENSGIEGLDDKIKSMTAKQNNSWICKVCGKSSEIGIHMRNHIETHITGIEHPCTVCGRTYRSRNSLSKHIS